MSEPRTFEVGGCTRDKRMGIPTKDVDFAVEIGSFSDMRDWLKSTGFEIFEEREEFLTIRAKVPKGHSLEERTKVADFVMCRKDSATSDGRRPDFVEPGDIFDDLARRDFTMNAIAEDTSTGEVLDPWDGIADIRAKKLRFVGDPTKRITEDGLRVLRGFRFMVTKDVMPDADTGKHMVRPLAVEMLAKVSTERIQQELHKMFAHDTLRTLEILSHHMPPEMLDIIFGDDKIKLNPTMKARI